MDQTSNPTTPTVPNPLSAMPAQPASSTPNIPPSANGGINLDPPNLMAHSGDDKKGSKMLWIIVLAIVLVGIVSGGAYYMTQLNKTKPAVTTEKESTSSSEFASLETEVNSIDMQDFNAEFTEIDQDLKGL